MSVATIAVTEIPIGAAPSFIERATSRILNEFTADAEDWSRLVTGLRRFEDAELLDEPKEAALKTHRQTLEKLIAFGEFMAMATRQPAFPNRETHQMVEATLQVLRDDLVIWHGEKLSPERSAEIMDKCFPA